MGQLIQSWEGMVREVKFQWVKEYEGGLSILAINQLRKLHKTHGTTIFRHWTGINAELST